jgi:hypothetical protein
MSTPDFQVDLRRGKAGEAFLMAQHPHLRLPPDGERRWDLETTGDVGPFLGCPPILGTLKFEVKCDSYDPAETPNFFLEQRTRVAGKPGELLGGPWRALAEGVDTFVYLYHNPKRGGASRAYWFYDIPALVTHLDGHMDDYEVRRVRGGRLTAVGVLVPRKTLKGLSERVVYQ